MDVVTTFSSTLIGQICCAIVSRHRNVLSTVITVITFFTEISELNNIEMVIM